MIREGSITQWSVRSPDYNPCDFFFWGTFKEKVFTHTNIKTTDEMTEIVTHYIERIDNNKIQRATRSENREREREREKEREREREREKGE